MPAEYNKYSPYYTTDRFGRFLDVLEYRAIPRNKDDTVFTINPIYAYRPDLLANDLYGRSNLWWVFAVRNPDILQDPIFDFYNGQIIYIPKVDSLLAALGN